MKKDCLFIVCITLFVTLLIGGCSNDTHSQENAQAELERMHSDLVDVTVDSYLIRQGISPAKFDSVGDEIVNDVLKYYETH